MIKCLKDFWNDESGVGVVEIILILVILIVIIAIFKDKIKSIVDDAFSSIETNSSDVLKYGKKSSPQQ